MATATSEIVSERSLDDLESLLEKELGQGKLFHSKRLKHEDGDVVVCLTTKARPEDSDILFITDEWRKERPSLQHFLGEEIGKSAAKVPISQKRIHKNPVTGRGVLFQEIVDLTDQKFNSFRELAVEIVGTLGGDGLVNMTMPHAITICLPVMEYSSSSLSAELRNFLSEVMSLSIMNTGNSETIFVIEVSEVTSEEGFKKLVAAIDPPNYAMPPNFHSDRPIGSIEGDDLGRQAIAEAIVQNVLRVWPDHVENKWPFAVHLSGRWGSGKSSILSFLREKLEADVRHTPIETGLTAQNEPQGWVVVEYNAWRMQDAGPPWWSLCSAVVEQGGEALRKTGQGFGFVKRDQFWQLWKLTGRWMIILLLAFLLLASTLVFEWTGQSSKKITTETNQTKIVTTTKLGEEKLKTQTDNIVISDPKSLSPFSDGSPLGIVIGLATFLGAIGALLKFLQGFNKTSTETAETIRSLRNDPTAELQARLSRAIDGIRRPIAVFIDDLDRCDESFVVELLQSLQTTYSNLPVLYVVAADRDWIVSAYNQVYKGFKEEISSPGQPLGYLFVKKIFQLSVDVPDLASADTKHLTEALIGGPKETELSPTEQRKMEGELRTEISKAGGDMEKLADIAVKVRQSDVARAVSPDLLIAATAPDAQEEVQHALLDFTDLFDGNPRSIKRLINAITFRQGYVLMSGEKIEFNLIVRWTILTLRFPYTAAHLAAYPDKIMKKNRNLKMGENPGPDAAFFYHGDIDKILSGLTEDDISKISRFG